MLIFLFVICLVSGCSKKTPYEYKGIELLENGNMEEKESDERPRGWWYNRGTNVNDVDPDSKQTTLTYDLTDPNNKCLKINGVTDSKNFAFWAQTISNNIPVGKKVKLKIRVKTENLTGTGAAIAIRCDDAVKPTGSAEQFTTTQKRIPIVDSSDKYYSIELNERIRADIKSITVYLLFLGNTSGTVYFDDASLIY